MPLYEFEHVVRLSAEQKKQIAEAITDWHATTFRAPRYIVACRFIDVDAGVLSETFIGGAPRRINRLFVSLRSGTNRTQEQLEGITYKLIELWNAVAGSETAAELRAVYIKGDLDVAFEGGFMLPMPGTFEQWVKDNTERFKSLADGGDVDFVGLMKEIEARPEFQR